MSEAPGGKKFRLNVCAVLADPGGGQVLVFRRVDRVLEPYCWQFPQGGLERGESPEAGLLRELREEIGTGEVTIVARAERPVRYEYPPEILAHLAKGDPAKAGFAGQEQWWFRGRLETGTEAIHFDHQPAEFDAFRWVTPAEAVALVVPFKKEAYRAGLARLGWQV